MNKNKSIIFNILTSFYIRLKILNNNFHYRSIFFALINMINNIIIIDIIFKKERNFINYSSYIYFFSPIFYFELLNQKYINKKNESENNLNYNNDQISLLIKKYFNINEIYDQIYFKLNNNIIIKIIIILFYFLILLGCIININNNLIKFINKLCSFCFFFYNDSLLPILMIIISRNLLINLSENFQNISSKIYLDFLIIIIFFSQIFLFNNFFVYSFGQNEKFYFLNSYIFYFNIICNIFSSIIIVIRFNIKFFINIQLFWIFFFTLKFKQNLFIFINDANILNKTINIFYFDIISISYLLTKFISFIFINEKINMKFLKFIEIAIFLIINIFLHIIFYYHKKFYNIESINNLFFKKDRKIFYAFFQIFEPLLNTMVDLHNQPNINSSIKKIREDVLNSINYYFYYHLIINKNDFKILLKGNSKYNFNINSLNSIISEKFIKTKTYKTRTNFTEEKKEIKNEFINLLNYFINFYIGLTKTNFFENFYENLREYLNYNKLLLIFLLEGKNFKMEYYLMKLLNSNKFKNKNNLLTYSIFRYLKYYIINIHDKDNIEKNNNIKFLNFVIILKVNLKYLKITKCFKNIIKYFTHNASKLNKIIEKYSTIIGKNLEKIVNLKKYLKNLIENKDIFENEKFKYIESILFNFAINKNLEIFDLNGINLLTENNDIFINKITKDKKIIIKKAPYKYISISGMKSNKLKDTKFLNIFPYIIRKNISKKLKEIFCNKNLKNESNNNSNKWLNIPLLSYNKLILLNKIYFSLLPSYNDNLYFLAQIEHNKTFLYNSALIDINGTVKKFGLFFFENFGLDIKSNDINIYDIFQIYKKEKEMNIINDMIENEFNPISYEVSLSKILNFVQKNLKLNNDKNFHRNYEILKEKYSKFKFMKIKIEYQNEFLLDFKKDKYEKESNDLIFNSVSNNKYQSSKIYLISISFENLYTKRESVLNMSVLIKNESVINLSINASVASQASLSGLKDNDWNITLSESKQIKNKNRNEIISFIYNFFLIILAFIILIAIKLIINKFKNDYQVLFFLREYNLIYFYNHFYFNNKIVIENEDNKNNIYNIIENEILKINENYSTYKFFKFYNQYYSNLLNEYHNTYFKKYIKKISKSSNLYKSINKPIPSILINGKYKNITYPEIFPNEINYFHALSQIENYYLFTDILNFTYNDFLSDESLELQYMYLILKNYISYYPIILEINNEVKNIFENEINRLKVIFLLFLYIFIIGNLFSLLLLYFTANLLDKKILKIIKKISEIENEQIIFLKKKLKLTKYLIKNEIKATKVLDSLKMIAKEVIINKKKTKVELDSSPRKSPNIKKGIYNNNFDFKNNNSSDLNESFNSSKISLLKRQDSINNFFNSNKKEENINFEYSKQTPIKNLCFRNKKVLYIIIIFLSIFMIFIIIFTPLILSLIELNKTKLFHILNINQFQTLIINYYFIIKYSILFNESNIYMNYTKIEKVQNIYFNFSYIMKILSNDYVNTYEIINDDRLCEVINDEINSEFQPMLSDICNFIPTLNTHLIIIISGITKHLAEISMEFSQSKRNFYDIQRFYHHKEIQIINYYFIISCMNTMNYILYNKFKPDFLSKINYLTNLLIIIFIIMLIVEILNYYQTNYLLLKKLSKSYNNHEIIEKFFVEQEKKTKKKIL